MPLELPLLPCEVLPGPRRVRDGGSGGPGLWARTAVRSPHTGPGSCAVTSSGFDIEPLSRVEGDTF